jgi:hypothetical protein
MEARQSARGVRAEARVPLGDQPARQAVTDASAEFKGLCQNCALRFTCRLPKPDGGVWRCRQYE